MATTGREMTKMAKAAQEELTHVIEDAGRAVDRPMHPHHPRAHRDEQHDAPKPHKRARGCADDVGEPRGGGTRRGRSRRTREARDDEPPQMRHDASMTCSAATDARRLDASEAGEGAGGEEGGAGDIPRRRRRRPATAAVPKTHDDILFVEDTVGDDDTS